jgi:DNA-binding Lrp family transcriptional regulator
MKKLKEKGIVLGFNALIDTDKLNYNFYKIDFYLNNLSRIDEMFEYSKIHPDIIYRMRTIGGPDFEIEVLVQGPKKLRELIDLIRKKFNEIDYYRVHRFEYTVKQVYLPGIQIRK